MDYALEEELKWKKERLGKVTSSKFSTFIKKGKDGKYFLSESKTSTDLIYRIAWERLILNGDIANGLERLSMSSKATDHGNTFEAHAIKRYQEETGVQVDYTNKFNQIGESIGSTPDAYVGDDGLLEVKCPFNGGNHLKSMLTEEVYNHDYWVQMQGQMWVTGRKWCDFVTYDPDLPNPLDLNIIKIERDQEFIDELDRVIKEVVVKVKEIVRKYIDKVEKEV